MRKKKIMSTIAAALMLFTSTSLSACSSNGVSAKTTPASDHIKSNMVSFIWFGYNILKLIL